MTDTEIIATQEEPREKPKDLMTGGQIQPVIPRSVGEMGRMARAVIISGLVPDSYKGQNDDETLSKVMIGIQKSLEVGLPPLTGLANIFIINKKPSIYGDAGIALVQSKGVVEWVKHSYEGEEGTADFKCVYKIKRKGQDEPYIGEFSMGDAQKAKLTGKPGPWMTYPKRMLFNRARAFALRDGFADCLSGLAIAEEVQDMPALKDLAPVDTSSLDDDIELNEETVSIPETGPEEGDAPISGGNDSSSPDTSVDGVAASTGEGDAAPSGLPICDKCKGKGSVPYRTTDIKTGEVLEGIEPCDCQEAQ